MSDRSNNQRRVPVGLGDRAYDVLIGPGLLARAGTLLAEGESIHLVAGTDNRARVLPDDLLALVQGA